MFVVRWLLGRVILLVDWLSSPRGVKREPGEQAALNRETAALALYQFKACPFCVKVRRAMKRHSLQIETRDAKNNVDYREELLQQGGKVKVPCLKIQDAQGQTQWLYESSDIIAYLEQRFVTPADAA